MAINEFDGVYGSELRRPSNRLEHIIGILANWRCPEMEFGEGGWVRTKAHPEYNIESESILRFDVLAVLKYAERDYENMLFILTTYDRTSFFCPLDRIVCLPEEAPHVIAYLASFQITTDSKYEAVRDYWEMNPIEPTLHYDEPDFVIRQLSPSVYFTPAAAAAYKESDLVIPHAPKREQ